jgi:hypothetical protein
MPIMSKYRDLRVVMKYECGGENLDQNAVNFLKYEEEI